MISEKARRRNTQTAENIIIAICLSLIGGFLDAYSYLLKGGVFANAQTGNVVLLFISLANNEFSKCIKYIIPIITFAFGIFVSETVKNKKIVSSYLRIKIVLFIECIIILGIAFAGKHVSNYLINCVISFLAGIQVATFDKVDGNPVATTMITGNLKSCMISMSKYIATRNREFIHSFLKYLVIIAMFGAGVFVGCLLIHLYADASILICEAFLVFSYIVIRKEEADNRLDRAIPFS